MSDVTRILEAAERGDPKAAEELLPLVYEELRKLAVAKMAHEAPNQTLQPTALVHEAWLRLVGNKEKEWDGRRRQVRRPQAGNGGLKVINRPGLALGKQQG